MSATVSQRRGSITDTWKLDAKGRRLGLATCECVHGFRWVEGGIGCPICVEAWKRTLAGLPEQS